MAAEPHMPHCVVARTGTAEGLSDPLASLPQALAAPAEAASLAPDSTGTQATELAAEGPRLCFLVDEETSYICDPPRLPAGGERSAESKTSEH